jgi:hypothetical protein
MDDHFTAYSRLRAVRQSHCETKPAANIHRRESGDEPTVLLITYAGDARRSDFDPCRGREGRVLNIASMPSLLTVAGDEAPARKPSSTLRWLTTVKPPASPFTKKDNLVSFGYL